MTRPTTSTIRDCRSATRSGVMSCTASTPGARTGGRAPGEASGRGPGRRLKAGRPQGAAWRSPAPRAGWRAPAARPASPPRGERPSGTVGPTSTPGRPRAPARRAHRARGGSRHRPRRGSVPRPLRRPRSSTSAVAGTRSSWRAPWLLTTMPSTPWSTASRASSAVRMPLRTSGHRRPRAGSRRGRPR